MRSNLKQKPRRRRPRARRIKPGWILLAALLAGALSVNWFYTEVSTPHEHQLGGQIVNIPAGSSANQVSAQLRNLGIIADSVPIRVWLQLMPIWRTYKAGDYVFSSPISAREVSRKLIAGEVYIQRVTFPEGYNRFDVARVIQGLAIPGAGDALRLTERIDLVADVDPDADSLEGYLFPDTYDYSSTTTAEQLVIRMVRRFGQVFSPDYMERARELGWSVRQVVSLASMVEREAKHPEERPLVSSVYHNRLKLSMKLDCDPTVIYSAMLAGDWTGRLRRADLNRKSRYNTYLCAGLPPGPIACPGQRSIEAALFPADTKYIYFVVDGDRADGSHRFARTVSEHAANVAAYRQYERERIRSPEHVTGPHH